MHTCMHACTDAFIHSFVYLFIYLFIVYYGDAGIYPLFFFFFFFFFFLSLFSLPIPPRRCRYLPSSSQFSDGDAGKWTLPTCWGILGIHSWRWVHFASEVSCSLCQDHPTSHLQNNYPNYEYNYYINHDEHHYLNYENHPNYENHYTNYESVQ